MHPDVQALLALQEVDGELDAIEAEQRKLAERDAALDRERAAVDDALARARARLTAEEERERAIRGKLDEHRLLQDRFQHQMDAVRKPREALAAQTQMELARRILADDESEVHAVGARVRDIRQSVELHELELGEVEERQGAARSELAAERSALDARAAEVRARRAERAGAVSAAALTKYERLRRRGQRRPLVELHETSCGNCHVAVPMSRRLDLLAGRALEVCEGCGSLLYASV